MAGPVARRDQDYVDPNIVPLSRVTMGHIGDGGGDPADTICVDGQIKVGCFTPSLDFNERGGVPAPRNQIYLSGPNFNALPDDTPAV
jgi:hypothetical protein